MNKSKPLVIGINGGSGSGKTSLVNELRSIYTRDQVCVISMDDYYFPREHQKEDRKGIRNFDLPESLDEKSFTRDVEILIKGDQIKKTEYTFNNSNKTPKEITISPAPIIVIEGLFVFHYAELAALMDYKVFIHADEDLKIIRRIRRDSAERNYPIDDVLYRYEHHVQPAYKKYIAPYKAAADIIINNQYNYDKGLDFLTAFISSKLIAT